MAHPLVSLQRINLWMSHFVFPQKQKDKQYKHVVNRDF